MVPPPLNFPKWLSENSHLLQPPVGNFCLFRTEDYTVMAVGGPNARSDYHYQPTEEFFYQYKGDMLLKIIDEDGEFKDVEIKEGEMFVLPPYTPHSPCRFKDTVGLVVERTRPEGKKDSMRWYCPNRQAHPKPHLIKEVSFQCTDLGTQLKPIIDEWMSDETSRKCLDCGRVAGPKELPA
ncbi:putative BNA1-3-hydroxyanthranilic acid dioxygenase [Violaceomyces palustris]|uniref:BNA1-3-hydroxyanthranilic acid dioxygenase n=1 Tax=Violaceomyces palustris TaxID=1673888 RepID=A0ACD0P605_9BASI|nr:putative BNA1-3-hydroxyanthranilic acid dioxygenase [Violaceomyces palustris]